MSEKEVRKMCNSLSLATTQWKMAVAQGRLVNLWTTCVLVLCSTRDTRLCNYEIVALANIYLCPRDSIIFIRPLLNTLLDSVYPPPEEESDRQKEDEWQPEVQRLCMELQQILTRWSIWEKKQVEDFFSVAGWRRFWMGSKRLQRRPQDLRSWWSFLPLMIGRWVLDLRWEMRWWEGLEDE